MVHCVAQSLKTNSLHTMADMEDFHEGQVFPSMTSLRLEVSRYFASLGIGHRKPVNNKTKLHVVCTEHVDCPFSLWAFKVSGCEAVTITTLVDEHALVFVDSETSRKRNPSRVSNTVLVPMVRSLWTLTNGKATIEDVQNHLRTQHRLTVSYHQAWRARKTVLDESKQYGSDSYKYIQDWMRRMVDANAGSVAHLERDSQSRFKRACIVHGAFAQSVTSTLPVLALDACHLKTKDKGTLYAASMLTGNFDIFIVGLAICNREENGEDWGWFLSAFVTALPVLQSMTTLVAISDREKGLKPAVLEHFLSAHHAFCSVHIKRNVQAKYHVNLGHKVHSLATAMLVSDVVDVLAEVQAIDAEISEYLIETDMSKWVTAYFPVPRYGIVTSNAAECMNSWIAKQRVLPHFAVFVQVTRRTMERLAFLRTRSAGWNPEGIVPWVEKEIRGMTASARTRLITSSTDGLFEVQRKNLDFRVVNLLEKQCSCGVWKEQQFPCVHGLAVILSQRRQIADFVSHFYKRGTVQAAVAPAIVPVDVAICDSDMITLPPVPYRSAGRPKTVRIRSRGEILPSESPIHCSRCGRTGHNLRTCSRRPGAEPVSASEQVQPGDTTRDPPTVWMLSRIFGDSFGDSA